MLKQMLSLALAVLVPLATACSTHQTRHYAPGEIPPPDSDERIVTVTRTSGERVAFDREVDGRTAPRARLEGEAIVGPVEGESVRVSLSEASSVSIEEKHVAVGRTILAVGAVAAATLFGIAAASLNSGW